MNGGRQQGGSVDHRYSMLNFTKPDLVASGSVFVISACTGLQSTAVQKHEVLVMERTQRSIHTKIHVVHARLRDSSRSSSGGNFPSDLPVVIGENLLVARGMRSNPGLYTPSFKVSFLSIPFVTWVESAKC
ncbi:unnamed protein product [Ectocarpus sp. 13 AM-2016]